MSDLLSRRESETYADSPPDDTLSQTSRFNSQFSEVSSSEVALRTMSSKGFLVANMLTCRTVDG